ncbi:N-acetylmuramoyl-L-alanine amidase [Streptomyces sp. MP131-18]|uniref:peptidoglycan recognition protein family protein n=1 Tax=Streptomyces sp. MP131-18 TaxID=1857892 RepID=UPI00097C030E|nr:N-acetylmuramoyl-L-alanine amidase [Streptomyces sp. MP131-18]ONK13121.1 N-acetylmuramoyl-L-alanine amidase [Streptomyces sp. MP131-18]
MAEPLSTDRLINALRDEGVRVVEFRNWRTHNRNHVGSWGPVHGVMIHHTVTTGTGASVELCYEGRSDLPGPLCHGVIAKDGTVHMVGHGRANHAGAGDGDVLAAVIAERELPADNEADTDGNRHFYGFECVNLGDNRDPWPPEQVEAIVRASAALCRAHHWGRDGDTSVIGHLEWQPGKIDPRGPGVSMRDIRRRVIERLKHPSSWNPNEEEEDMPERAIYSTTAQHVQTIRPGAWHTLTFDRVYREGEWQEKHPEQTVLHGPASYTGAFAIRVAGMTEGQEIQMRFGHNYRDDDGWHQGARMPISSPVHSGGDGHFVHNWPAHIGGSRDDRLVCEVLLPGDVEPVTITWGRAEILYWTT